VTVVTLENLRMRVGAWGGWIRPPQMAIAALVDQGMQAGLAHIAIHEERLMCGMALDTRRVRIRNPEKTEVFLPIHLGERSRPGIQFAMADQTILPSGGNWHLDVVIPDMPCAGSVTRLTRHPAVGILVVDRDDITMTLGTGGAPDITHAMIPRILKGRTAVEPELAKRFRDQPVADTQGNTNQNDENDPHGIDVPVIRTNQRFIWHFGIHSHLLSPF